MSKSFTPTDAMRNNARRGLAMRKRLGRGGLDASEAKEEGVGSGVARARDIINGNLSLETVKRMHAFFSRHEKNYKPGKMTPGTAAWLIWGGSAGRAWARNILRKEGIIKSMDALPMEDDTIEEDVPDMSAPIAKSVNEELKQATYVVMSPDEADLHGDETSADEVRKAKENFNEFLLQQEHSKIDHLYATQGYKIIESYLAPADMILNEVEVKKGAWLATVQFYDDDLWEGAKSGLYQGLSIGAMARVQEVNDD